MSMLCIVIRTWILLCSVGRSNTGERDVRRSHMCVSACCVVFNQEHWRGWIETQQENKRTPHALSSIGFPHITGCLLILQPLMFLYFCWRERCWLRCSILLSHLLSWLLHESRQRGQEEQLIGICWASLTSDQTHCTALCFRSSALAGWASLEESTQLLD